MADFNSTIYTQESRLNPPSPIGGGHGLKGVLKCKSANVAVSTALGAADLLNFFYMPRGAVVQDIKLESGDLDSDGTPAITIHIGDAADPDRLMVSSAAGQAGVTDRSLAATGRGYQYTEDTLVRGTIAVAADVAVAGTVRLTLFYTQEDFTTS